MQRRRFLSGIGGLLCGLPLLEAASVRGQGLPPARYVVMFAGVSTGRVGVPQALSPTTTGTGFVAPRALQPLVNAGLLGRSTVYSNLLLPTPTNGVVPPGGRGRPWHSSSLGPLLSGLRANDSEDRFSPLGPTSDQLVASLLGAQTRFRSLEYKVQASGYRDETSGKRIMSYRAPGVPNEPITSPSLAYSSLFSGFVPEDPRAAEEARRRLQQQRSMVSLVRQRTERLRGRLGVDDRRRLERHADELRALEGRLSTVEPDVDAQCRQLDAGAYANDAGVVNTVDQSICAAVGQNTPECQERVIGYAQENLRGRLLSDLVQMAFRCDLSRVATIMLTHAQSFMNIADIVQSGVVTDAHECGHGTGTTEDFEDVLAWHVGQFAYLVGQLRDAEELGGSLLDRTVVTLVFEGGFGFDPESNDAAAPHSSENMVALVAGGEALGLSHGSHIRTAQAHPASVLLRSMRAVGYEGSLGDIESPL
jgi:hypothetical protein